MNGPSNPLGWAVWRRGAILGLGLAVVFFAVTGVAYAALGVFGWSGVVRALCAMAVGPVLGLGVALAWLAIRRPSLAPESEPGDSAETEDPERTQVSRRTVPFRIKDRGAGEKSEDSR